MPADTTVLAGIDVDRLRSSPLLSKLPESMRDGSYALAGYNGRELVTASRVGNRVVVSGGEGKGAPPDLLRHAADAPLWIVARGAATLPLAGNLANINRLLHQTEYTTVAARIGPRIELHIEGICRTPAAAEHLEENIRAIASLTKFPLGLARDGAIVRVDASIAAEALP
jgi:hypothetical protein